MPGERVGGAATRAAPLGAGPRLGTGLWLAAGLWLGPALFPLWAAGAEQAPGDPAAPGMRADSAGAAAAGVKADSARAAAAADIAAAADTALAALPSAVDFDAQRKRGEVSFDAAILGRRTALFVPMPLYGAPVGSIAAPDAGSRIRPDHPGVVADVATDRTLVDTGLFGLGVPDLAIGFDDPRGDSVDPMDLLSLSGSVAPGHFSRAGALLAEPKGVPAASGAMPGGSTRLKRARSALYYGNGDGGEKEAAVRFVVPSLGKGIAAGYERHEAGGTGPLYNAKSTRYTAAVGLPGLARHSFWITAKWFERSIEDFYYVIDPSTSALSPLLGDATSKEEDAALHGRASGRGWASEWSVRAGSAQRTLTTPSTQGTLWKFPEWSAEWSASKAAAPGWTATIHATGSVRQVEFRAGAAQVLDARRDAARVEAGLRRDLGARSGAALVLAPDFRETDSPLLDARASYWTAGRRAAARIDLESAHERPSWVDLMSPSAIVTTPHADGTTYLELSTGGDPSLSARRLAGALAAGSLRASRHLGLSGTASLRHVSHDFGWNAALAASSDTLYLTDRAVSRGSGWVSHGSIAAQLEAGIMTLRILGWARGGPEGLTPLAGAPPRYGGEGAADFRGVFFGGDLALTLGLRAHAWGPRSGIIEEPGAASFDFAIRGDFGAAGAFAEWVNAFNRRVPSAMIGLELDGAGAMTTAVAMPGTAFHFGLVWYLMD